MSYANGYVQGLVESRTKELKRVKGELHSALEREQALAAHVERLEFALTEVRSAISNIDIDAMGVVPETHDCPAYPIRDAVLNDITVAIQHHPSKPTN